MDTLESIIESWEAEVKCLRCKVKKFVPYKLRHAGTKKASLTSEGSPAARCSSPACPVGADYTEWTGKKRVK